MDFFKTVERRYSHKEKFLPDSVPLEHLERIAEAGLKAPNGMNKQCVKLIILPDREAVQPLCSEELQIFNPHNNCTANRSLAQ